MSGAKEPDICCVHNIDGCPGCCAAGDCGVHHETRTNRSRYDAECNCPVCREGTPRPRQVPPHTPWTIG